MLLLYDNVAFRFLHPCKAPMNPFRLARNAAALSTALSVHARQAAPPVAPAPAAGPADDKMQKVEVKGSANACDARRDDSASKIVVSSEEILKYGDANVMDVLKRVPGITSAAPPAAAEVKSACAAWAPAIPRS